MAPELGESSLLAGRTLGLASWVWMRSLTRSMGAVAVLAMEPETPPCDGGGEGWGWGGQRPRAERGAEENIT